MAQGIYTDIYVLAGNRSAGFIQKFLARFLPHREESAAEYEVPQYADKPEKIFSSAAELMEHCELNPAEEHTIYWSSTTNGDPRNALVQYTSEGACILGLSINDPGLEDDFLKRLKAFSGSEYGYITTETPPAITRKEFIENSDKLRKS